jgi:hypothetical protein
VFGNVTAEELDLMTLEQVRMWTLARRQTAGALAGVASNPERAQGSATARQELMPEASGWSGLPPSGPEVEEDDENEDYSWMDDMEAAGVSPL